MTNILSRFLTGGVSPVVYILMFMSSFIGFCFMTGLVIGGGDSVLYGSGVLVDRVIWGALLHFTATAALFGLITRKDYLISLGGITGFMLWTFACISLAMTANWYGVVTLGLLHVSFHAYVVLANSLGYLYR